MKVRLTQRDLKFGVYWGAKGSLNPGLNLFVFGRFVWPIQRNRGKRKKATQKELPLAK